MKAQHNMSLVTKYKQSGFLLWQMALVVTLLSIVTAYEGQKYWQTTMRTSRDERAQLVGAALAAINDATKTYTTTFFAEIQQTQNITRNGYTLPPVRILTPTAADLNGMGFLASRYVNPVIYNGQSISFNIKITVDTSSGCTIPTCNLPFQITSSVPLIDPSSNQVDIRRATMAAAKASPGNAGVSMPTSFGGNPGVFVAQNGTQTGTNPGGVAGLISISNGYDSSGFFVFDRRDGSLPRTGDINMQDTAGMRHNINNAAQVNANTLTSNGFINVNGYAVEGDNCPDGNAIAVDSNTKYTLTCKNATWQKSASSSSSLGIVARSEYLKNFMGHCTIEVNNPIFVYDDLDPWNADTSGTAYDRFISICINYDYTFTLSIRIPGFGQYQNPFRLTGNCDIHSIASTMCTAFFTIQDSNGNQNLNWYFSDTGYRMWWYWQVSFTPTMLDAGGYPWAESMH